MSATLIPSSVRYIKNGKGGCWWSAALKKYQVHAGWHSIPHTLLLDPGDFSSIRSAVDQDPTLKDQGARTRDFNQLHDLLDLPSKHVWVTFEDGFMWWCTVCDGSTVNKHEEKNVGNFWLTCNRVWSNQSIGGKLLAVSELPGSVNRTGGFRGTVCKPQASDTILRLIHDQKDPNSIVAAQARANYEQAVGAVIQQLTWQDFEQLIDMILARTSWTRISTLGGTQEGYDIEVENLVAGEIAFVQVKGACSQDTLNDYVERFMKRRDRYARMIFAVHTNSGELVVRADIPVQVWTVDRLAQLVVQLGLGLWVESRLG